MFLKRAMMKSTGSYWDSVEQLKYQIKMVDAVVIGAGAGLSTAAGFTYSGERFQKYFADFIEKYHFKDMYSGGFYPFETLGILVEVHLHQPLYGRSKRYLQKTFRTCKK